MFRHFALAAIAAFGFSTAVLARDLTPEESAALTAKVAAHESLLHAKDAGGVIDDFPPGVLSFIAKMTSMEEPAARQQGIDTMMAAAEGASFDAYDIDLDNASEVYALEDGTEYVLLPTTMIELPGDGTKVKDEVTIAVLVDGAWYLIGFDNPDEAQLLIAAVPAFADPNFLANFNAALAE